MNLHTDVAAFTPAFIHQPKVIELNWFVVRARLGKEKDTRARIEAQGFTTFMPLMWKTIRQGRQSKKVTRPMLSPYIFAQMPEDGRWAPIANTRGVKEVLAWPDGTLQSVPDSVIADMRAALVAAGGVFTPSAEPKAQSFETGQRVRICEGPATGLTGVFLTDSGDTAEITLDILGGTRPVKLPMRMVEAVEG